MASIAGLAIFGLNFGIDFKGGTLMTVSFQGNRPDNNLVREKLKSLDLGEINIQPVGASDMMFRLRDLDEPTHQKISATLKKEFGQIEERQFDSVGPVIGKELQRQSIYAVIAVIIAIVLYITWAFRKVSKPVSSWLFGVATIIALVHDVIIPVGAFSYLGHFAGKEVGLLFVTALLTILGFSVHDTIVVFDRVRENLRKWGRDTFEDLVNQSVNETLRRSINTSLTVILTLFAIYFLGGDSTKDFALALIIGIFAGTYSSIFIASTLLVWWHTKRAKYQS